MHAATSIATRPEKPAALTASSNIAVIRRPLPAGERLMIRTAHRGDAETLQSYVRGLSTNARYNRFFGALSELPPTELARMTRVDEGGATLIAETGGPEPIMVAELRYAILPDAVCEFSVSVTEDWRRKGVGSLLLDDLLCRIRALGIKTLTADVLRSNEEMLAFAHKAGFAVAGQSSDPRGVQIVKDISAQRLGLQCGESGAVDFLEAGQGPLVVLLHSSMSGARQWSALTRDLAERCRVRAINFFGYGGTPPWSRARPPSLDDLADLVAAAVPATEQGIHLVGHSFGGAVAMQAASRLRRKLKSLVLIEPSLFCLLDEHGRRDAFREISALAAHTKRCVADGNLEAAAERFIDYWSGPGAWAASSPGRKSAVTHSITLLPNEWDALLETTTPWAERIAALPAHTLVLSSANALRPSREIVELLSQARTDWEFVRLSEGGHMAPLTHPHLLNPLVSAFIADETLPAQEQRQCRGGGAAAGSSKAA